MYQKNYKTACTLRRHCSQVHGVEIPTRNNGRPTSRKFGCRTTTFDAGTPAQFFSNDDEFVLSSPWSSEQNIAVTTDNPDVACRSAVDPDASRAEPSRTAENHQLQM